MQAEAMIKRSITFIEQNLKEPIQIEELANLAGYSLGHYQKLFSQITGTTVANFLNKRRLDATLIEIRKGRRAIDVAFDYGFESYAGFYKAFIRIYGNSPKKYLSKEESSMQTENDLRKILENWDIPQDLPIINVPILDGMKVSDNVWMIGEDYILKTEEKSRLLNNLNIIKTLAHAEAHVGVLIPTKSGKDYFDGDQMFTLTKGVKGNPLSEDDFFGENREQYALLYGENIAYLHQNLKKVEPQLKVYQKDLIKEMTEWAMPLVKKINLQWSMNIPDSFFKEHVKSTEKLFPKLPQQLIHRDPNPGNIIFEKGKVSGFVDFDISERSARLWDPCYCATGILSSWNRIPEIKTRWPAVLSGVLTGYDQINPLTAEEKEAVYYMICNIQMVFIAYCDDIPELQELAKANREMLLYIIESEVEIKKIFQ